MKGERVKGVEGVLEHLSCGWGELRGGERDMVNEKWKGHQVRGPCRVKARWNWVLKGVR